MAETTRSQRWSKGALERVLAQKGRENESKYRTLCFKMPGLIQQAGLVQALVFMLGREKDDGKAFVEHLAQVHGSKACKLLVTRAQEAALPEYLALTEELSQVSLWFRRFAQVELESEKEKST